MEQLSKGDIDCLYGEDSHIVVQVLNQHLECINELKKQNVMMIEMITKLHNRILALENAGNIKNLN